jgi:peptidoglycan/LPS O-acetylase OafA/YrhL
MYGRIAVVFFLVLSGFSLALSPAASGWRLDSVARFARRRAFRILPAYWAALAISLVIAATMAPASHLGPPTRHTVVVYALLAQDIVVAPTPNGAFWSIAVEVELYLVFPVLIFLRRRLGPAGLLLIACLPVVAFGLSSDNGTPIEGVNHLMLDLAPVFVAGILAASAVNGRNRRMPWLWLSLAAGIPVVCLIVTRGPVWTANHYFWIDLAVVPSMTLFLIAVATGRPTGLRRLLDSAPLRTLGSFSYSLYLIHLPIVMVISRKIAKPHFGHGVSAFLTTLLIGVPLSIVCAWLFAKAFEAPFRRNRPWSPKQVLGRVSGRVELEVTPVVSAVGDRRP